MPLCKEGHSGKWLPKAPFCFFIPSVFSLASSPVLNSHCEPLHVCFPLLYTPGAGNVFSVRGSSIFQAMGDAPRGLPLEADGGTSCIRVCCVSFLFHHRRRDAGENSRVWSAPADAFCSLCAGWLLHTPVGSKRWSCDLSECCLLCQPKELV